MIDVDEVATWPVAVGEQVRRWADETRGSTIYPGDLDLPFEGEDELAGLLVGERLRAYHCTRLLDHEIDEIRGNGLRLLTPELIASRIDAAQRAGLLHDDTANLLRHTNVFASGGSGHRRDQVWMFLSQFTLRDEVSGVAPLLSTWGGEGIYMANGAREVRPVLEGLGTPTVVVADVELTTGWRSSPSLHKVFTAASLGLKRYGCDLNLRTSVPASAIDDIWQPGHPAYDRFPRLPRN